MSSPSIRAPYRSEPVGSLLRPDWLRDARRQREAGQLSPDAFKRIEDRAVDEAIALQQDAGLDVITDGEMRRGHFTGSLSEVVAGMEAVDVAGHRWREAAGGEQRQLGHQRAVTGTLRRIRSLAQEEYTYARARASQPVKVTLPSPLMMQTFWSDAHSRAAYADPFAMFADAASILRDEVRELWEMGCTDIQIDAPELALMVDDSAKKAFRTRGIDPDRVLAEGVELLNGVVDVPGPRYGLHLCRGNREGHYMASGGYEAISSAVLQRATAFHTFFLEYDDERSGGFAPLADLGDDQTVVLGLVTTKRGDLEDPDELRARIEEAARLVGHERLALSPQCGFASMESGNPISAEDQARKLRLVVDVARSVWDG